MNNATKDPIELVGNETAIPASPASGNVNKEHATIVGAGATETGNDEIDPNHSVDDVQSMITNVIVGEPKTVPGVGEGGESYKVDKILSELEEELQNNQSSTTDDVCKRSWHINIIMT